MSLLHSRIFLKHCLKLAEQPTYEAIGFNVPLPFSNLKNLLMLFVSFKLILLKMCSSCDIVFVGLCAVAANCGREQGGTTKEEEEFVVVVN